MKCPKCNVIVPESERCMNCGAIIGNQVITMENIPPQESLQKKFTYSRVGIVSFIISVLIPFTIFFGGDGLILGILMSLTGILIGIAGIIHSYLRKKKKLFAVLGLIFNILLLFGLLWIFFIFAFSFGDFDR